MPVSVSHELLDVVDENDNVITVKTRGEIHAQGLMHRAVHILVFNSDGELFLQKRSLSKDEQPGKWDSSAAGHLDSGEDYHDCARREIAEEPVTSIAWYIVMLTMVRWCWPRMKLTMDNGLAMRPWISGLQVMTRA
jgi:hypothetical protein